MTIIAQEIRWAMAACSVAVGCILLVGACSQPKHAVASPGELADRLDEENDTEVRFKIHGVRSNAGQDETITAIGSFVATMARVDVVRPGVGATRPYEATVIVRDGIITEVDHLAREIRRAVLPEGMARFDEAAIDLLRRRPSGLSCSSGRVPSVLACEGDVEQGRVRFDLDQDAFVTRFQSQDEQLRIDVSMSDRTEMAIPRQLFVVDPRQLPGYQVRSVDPTSIRHAWFLISASRAK